MILVRIPLTRYTPSFATGCSFTIGATTVDAQILESALLVWLPAGGMLYAAARA